VRRLLALLGVFALVRAWIARRRAAGETALPGEGDSRAEELRRRLAESRELAGDQEDFSSGETPVDAESAEERRREVHERGRAAIDDMRKPGD
jgi:hypothetical protein